MLPGDRIADRYVIERFVGSGGMGSVFRAHRADTREPVAIKVLDVGGVEALSRFEREARVLQSLAHPAIVGYVDHGVLASGKPYLAMEWLEGEELESRISRAGLSIAEVVSLARRVATALAAAHASGLVHRDIKPSNLVLVDGRVELTKVLDFGVVRIAQAGATTTTRTGTAVGTPAYMAPEQARGDPSVDARADVFALGCVLFECLTGRPPFTGDHAFAILAKILLEEPPSPRELRADTPPQLDDLVRSMLAKERDRRPADGAAVLAALDAIDVELTPAKSAGLPSFRPPALTSQEQLLVSVVVASHGSDPPAADGTTATSPHDELSLIRRGAQLGAEVALLADGTLLAAFGTGGTGGDHARQAARAALLVRRNLRDARLALATGRGVLHGRVPVGEVIDRAAMLLEHPAAARGIAVDRGTVGLLDESFTIEVAPEPMPVVARERRATLGTVFVLVAEHEAPDETRTLLGRPTPCVGRDRELGLLVGTYDQCVGDGVSRVVVLTGPAGIGKSRLRFELLRRVRARPEASLVVVARGDPVSAGSPFGIVGQLLRRIAGLSDGEPVEARRERLLARTQRHMDGDAALRTAEFLGELCSTPFDDAGRPALRAARGNPILMGDRTRRAFADFLAAECAAQPVVLVLEDLHWGDGPSVRYVAQALRELPETPLLVVALGRPEALELFPDAWENLPVLELRLAELSPRSAEHLVRAVLGDGAGAGLVERIVQRAGGNAFFLEELVRAYTDRAGDATMPDSVLAMVSARLERLAPETRRVLRAASIFGQAAWLDGLTMLCGADDAADAVASAVDELVELEVLGRRSESRIAGQRELAFRHALVRDAAYSTLTEEDRALGHSLAGQWLESAGERDPAILAEHFERGGANVRAATLWDRAAAQALDGNDFAAALVHVHRGLSAGATGAVRGGLRRRAAEAHRWRGEFADAETAALDAIASLPHGSDGWSAAAVELVVASGMLGHLERIETLATELTALPFANGASILAAARAAIQLLMAGRFDRAEILLARIESADPRIRDEDPSVLGRVLHARAARAQRNGEQEVFLELSAQCALAFDRAGDARTACAQRSNLGHALLELGNHEEALPMLQDAAAVADRMGLAAVGASANNNLGLALLRAGRLDDAFRTEAAAADACARLGDRRTEGNSRGYLAEVLLAQGKLDEARAQAERAVELLDATPPLRAPALATLSRVLVAQGDAASALSAATRAMQLLDDLGRLEEGEGLVRLAHAEALRAAGDPGASDAVATAKRRLVERASAIADATLRRRFLAIGEHARTFELARGA